MKLIYIISFICMTNAVPDKMIDPHDMNTNVKEQYMKRPQFKKSWSTNTVNEEVVDPLPDTCHFHLKRLVSVIINSAHIDKRDSEVYHGNIRFSIDSKEFDFLVNFGKEDLTLEKLRKLDTVISESFKRTYIDEYLDKIESLGIKLYSLVVNIQNLWLLGVFYLSYVVYQLFKNNFSFGSVSKYLIMLIIIVDFGFRYQNLLEEAEEHNLKVAYSSDCDSTKMSWGQWTKYMFSTRNCEKKIVTPLDVFLFQIKNLIIIPMQAFGTGMGGFGNNMFTSLPFGLSIVMWPVLLIFILIGLLFIVTICTGQSIDVNIFHLFKLKFGGGIHKDNTLTVPTVEKLMDKLLHRPMVQNVHVSVPSNDINKSDRKNIDSEPLIKISNSLGLGEKASTSDKLQQDSTMSKKTSSHPSDKGTNTSYQVEQELELNDDKKLEENIVTVCRCRKSNNNISADISEKKI